MAGAEFKVENPFADPIAEVPSGEGTLGDERVFFESTGPLWRKRVFLPEDAARLHEDAENGLGIGMDQRQTWIERMAVDTRTGWRDLVTIDDQVIKAVENLAEKAGHAQKLFDLLLPAFRASRFLARPVELPPILLVSPPGVGKTYLGYEIAKRIKTAVSLISVPNQSSTGVFTGLDASWRASRPGEIAQTLVKGETAQPLMLLDEIDKATRANDYGFVLGPLHDLWEKQSAAHLEDDFIKLRFAADRILWIATANSLHTLMPSILDRAIVIELPSPSTTQMLAITQSIYENLRLTYGDWFVPQLPAEVVRSLSACPPRSARQILGLALTRAASEGRQCLGVDDIAHASSFAGQSSRQRMGFL